ncbi:MAG: hypothetical protein WCX83_02775 [Candidatus Cloacimonas sp.]|nr:hypothetical protein [Candidatus Cloacimonadota bacterium]
MKLQRYCYFGSLALFLIILTSCSSIATNVEAFKKIERSTEQGYFAEAVSQIEANKGKLYSKKDRVLYYLDLGLLYHYNGDFEKSNELLTEADLAIEDLFTKSVSKAAASLLLNDNALEYPGEDYEDIYVSIFKALNYLQLNKFDEAFVEIRRVNEKLNILEDKYKDLSKALQKSEDAKATIQSQHSRFHNSIFARYISMLLYLAEGMTDEAMIDKKHIKSGWLQQANIYDFPQPNFDKYFEQSQKPKVRFVSFTGKAPYKKPAERRIATTPYSVIITGNEPYRFYDEFYWPGIEGSYYFKFSLPYMHRKDSNVKKIKVYTNDEYRGELEKIEDIGNLAVETFAVKAPIIYFKAFTRSIIKGVVAEKAKEEMKKKNEGFAGMLLGLAADIAVDISENADLRTSRFLPNEVYVGEVELDSGVYNIRIDYLDSYGRLIHSHRKEGYEVKNNPMNMINSYYPN